MPPSPSKPKGGGSGGSRKPAAPSPPPTYEPYDDPDAIPLGDSPSKKSGGSGGKRVTIAKSARPNPRASPSVGRSGASSGSEPEDDDDDEPEDDDDDEPEEEWAADRVAYGDEDEDEDDDDADDARLTRTNGAKNAARPRYAAISDGGRVPSRVHYYDEPTPSSFAPYRWLARKLPWWCPPRALLLVLTGATIVAIVLSLTLRKIHNRYVVSHCVPVAPRNASAPPRRFPDLPEGVTLPPDPFGAGLATQAALDAYIAKEHAYTDGMTETLASLRTALASEISARSPAVPPGAPPLAHWRHADGWYYALRDDLAAYVRSTTRDGLASPDASATGVGGYQVVVRLRTLLRLREKDEIPAIGVVEVSPDGTFIAVSVDRTGAEHFDLYLWDVAHQRRLGTGLAVKDSYYTARWVSNTVLVASVVDALGIPRGAVRVALENLTSLPTITTTPLYWEPAPERTLHVSATADGSLLVLQSAGQTSQQVLVVPAAAVVAGDWDGLVAHVGDAEPNTFTDIEHHQGYLYVRTNAASAGVDPATSDMEVVRIPYDVTYPTNVTTAMLQAAPERTWPRTPGTTIEKMEVFARFLVLWVRAAGGRREVRWRSLDWGTSSGEWHRLADWDARPFYTVTPGFAADINDPSSRVYRRFDATALSFTNSSPAHPPATYELDLVAGTVLPVTRTEVTGLDAGEYTQVRVWAHAPSLRVFTVPPPAAYLANPASGEYIPVDLVWSRRANSPNTFTDPAWRPLPVLATAYGAYGSMSDPGYDAAQTAALDRGLALAIVHPRGDGDLGPAWYRAGSRTSKRNTFADVRVAIAALQAARIAEPGRVALRARSAGGLVAGAAVADSFATCGSTTKKWPGLALIVAQVPFVDLVADMADVSTPWTAFEWAEWGDPRNRTELAAMAAVSPYDLLGSGDDPCFATVNATGMAAAPMPWPAVMVTTGRTDARVPYAEPVRWVAKMRHVQARALGVEAPIAVAAAAGAGSEGERSAALRKRYMGPARPTAWSSPAGVRLASRPAGDDAVPVAEASAASRLYRRSADNSTTTPAPGGSGKCRETEDLVHDRPVLLRVYAGGHFSGQDAAGTAEWMAVALNVLGVYDAPVEEAEE
ncbi:hypothetical protein H9P43_008809 [Blastocladiella emersonii ATCC 22665]|nr:hypothetical protein H9P43_008809 [Blastocladiella emersonii ATCC 22665]